MIWLAPWALAGLLAVALPVLIHLLGRGRAKTEQFPTLRFIEQSRLLPTQRTRIHDVLLLLVRAAIIASAALALAQPYWRTATRRDVFQQSLARAIIVDTSMSVRRALGPDSTPALLEQLTREANVSVRLTSAHVVDAIPGAVAWLTQQAERRELVIVSDFQTGVMDAQSVARVPAGMGLRLVRIGTDANPAATAPMVEGQARFGDRIVMSQTSIGVGTGTPTSDVEWHVRADTSRSEGRTEAVRVLAGVAERSRADAALAAASSTTASLPAIDSSRSIVIVTRGYEQRTSLLATARLPRRAWMVDAIVQISRDAALRDAVGGESAAGVATVRGDTVRGIEPSSASSGERAGSSDGAANDGLRQTNANADSTKGLIVARTTDGRALITAFESAMDSHPTLLLVDDADAGSITTAALIGAAQAATAVHPGIGELDPTRIADSLLRAWQRVPDGELRPTASGGGRNDGGTPGDVQPGESPDGRWLWLFALLLLMIETWMRRQVRETRAEASAP